MEILGNPRSLFAGASAKHDLIERDSTIIVGVSGGADSVCLLHVLKTLAPEYNLQLHVAHLDHQLRGDAARADADFVRDLAQRWNLPYSIDSRDVTAFARQHKLSIEEAARQVRYGFLLDVALAQGSETIAVAHHADDQTESVLMHFLRGSGLGRPARHVAEDEDAGNERLEVGGRGQRRGTDSPVIGCAAR